MIWEVWNTDSCHAGPYTWIPAECWIGSVCEAFVYPNKDTQRPDWQAEPKFLNSCSPRPTEQLSCCWLTGSRIWNTLFCLWGHTFQYSYCLPFYLHFLHLIRALSANTGTLSLTSNRIMFSNNLQSTAYTDCFDCTISNIRSYNNFLFPFPFFLLQKPQFTCFTQRDSPAELPGRKFPGESFLQHLRLNYCPSSVRSHFCCCHKCPTLYKKHPFIFFTLCLPKEDFE